MREPYDRRVLAELAELLAASGWKVVAGEVVRPPWHARAACRGAGPAAFFPTAKGPGQAERAYQAARQRWCSGCPVVAECLAAGEHEDHGLWGGLSPSARGRRRRRVA